MRRRIGFVISALATAAAAGTLGGCATTVGGTTIGPPPVPPAVVRADAQPMANPPEPASLAPPTVDVRRIPWRFSAYPGRILETPNYLLHTTISNERLLERMPIFLETALLRYTTAFGPLPEPETKLETYIFRDRRQWSAKTRQVLPEQASTFQNLGRGGFTTQGVSVLYYIDWAGRDRDTLAIAAHEGWHQYTQSTFRNPLPIWLEEGVATYMEGYRFRRSDRYPEFEPARNGERRSALGEAFRRDRLIPLGELLAESPQSFLGDGKGRLLTYYAQVWALTRFLVDGEGGRYRAALTEAMTDAAEGRLYRRIGRSPTVLAHGGRRAVGSRSGPWLILAYFSNDLTEFERAYLDFARGLAR